MVMKAAPVAALIVAEPELLLKLEIIAFDTPAHLDRIDESFEARLCGQRTQEVFGRARLAHGPLDDQPFFCTQHLAVCHAHPCSGKTRSKARVATFAPGYAAVRLSRQCLCNPQCTDRLMTRIAHRAFALRSAFGLGRHRPG